ncbi:MAG: phosphoenolpyruvate--protein phosphotransferase [Cellulomonadaceae bacterium]
MSQSGRVELTGIGVSRGRAAGPVLRLEDPVPEPAAALRLPPEADHCAQADRIARAVQQVASDLERAGALATGEPAAVLSAMAAIALDPTLTEDARRRVVEGHLLPERAVWETAEDVAAQFAELGGHFAERAGDIADVRDRIVAALTDRPAPGVPHHDEPYVLVATDLAPSTTATLDTELVLAIVTRGAGPTSHTAIVANARGIPAVVATGEAADLLVPGSVALVDGGTGLVVLNPTPAEVALVADGARRRTFSGQGRTADGHRVELLANIAAPGDADVAVRHGAEGVGLLRSEFCFLGREHPPTVAEQVAQYRTVFAAFPGRKVVIRTLDSGADKPLPFLTGDHEENPALGVRGVRATEAHPELLETQLTAIATAARAEQAHVWVMAPMVSTVPETEDFVAACARHGLETAGVMIEVPSAALLAGPILSRAAFASIGTNDLTQYTMAADRLLGSLAELADPWQPAVLRLIAATCEGARRSGRPVGVCGEAASHTALATVLVGLGVTSLSMTPRAIGDVAASLAAVTFDQCRAAADLALRAETAQEARSRVRERLPQLAELGL